MVGTQHGDTLIESRLFKKKEKFRISKCKSLSLVFKQQKYTHPLSKKTLKHSSADFTSTFATGYHQ